MASKTAQNSGTVQKPKGKPRGKPFAKNDPRRNNGGVPPDVREVKAALALEGHALVKALMRAVKRGNVIAIKTGLEYVLGKAPQSIELTGKDGGPIETTRRVDPSKLTTEQLKQLRELLALAAKS